MLNALLTCDYLIRFEYERKGTLLVVGSLLALSLATVTTARAAGTLNFTGKLLTSPARSPITVAMLMSIWQRRYVGAEIP